MREIKFRSWDKERKKISPVWELYLGNGPHYAKGKRRLLLERCELMQFTGLLDKHGKEIYEGDVVKIDKRIYEVWFKHGGFVMTRTTKAGKQLTSPLKEFVEIIGNVHASPKLLANE